MDSSKIYDFVLVVAHKLDENIVRNRMLAQALNSRGYRVLVLTTSSAGDYEMSKFGVPYRNLFDLIEECRLFGDQDERELEKISSDYGILNFYDLLLTHCQMFNMELRKAIRLAVQSFHAIERLFEECKVRCVEQHMGGEIFRRVVYRVARRRGIPVVYQDFSPIRSKIRFSSSEDGSWLDLDTFSYEMLTTEDLARAEEYIAAEKSDRRMACPSPKRVGLFNPVHVFRGMLETLMEGMYHKYYLDRGRTFESVRSVVLDYPITRFRRRIQFPFLKSFDNNIKYYFFPVHYPIETQLTIRGRPFVQQEWLIEYLARSIPQGFYLLLKEHPFRPGQLPLSTIRKTASLPNVRWLRPEINSHLVIERTRAVVTINSTAGFEALLYQKPVVTLGSSFYARRGLTIDVSDLTNLHQALNQAIEWRPEWQQVVKFVAALIIASYEGSDITDFSLLSIEALADSLLQYCRRNIINWEPIPSAYIPVTSS